MLTLNEDWFEDVLDTEEDIDESLNEEMWDSSRVRDITQYCFDKGYDIDKTYKLVINQMKKEGSVLPNNLEKVRQGVYSTWDDLCYEAGDFDESLKEDFDDVVEIEVPVLDISTEEIDANDTEPKGPEVGEDTGLTDMLLNLLNGENDTIRDYNIFKANLSSHPDFVTVIEDITNEEMNHVGMLQTLLKRLSPNAETIKQGEVEAEGYLKDDEEKAEGINPISDIDMTTDLVDDVDDEFYSRYV